MPTISLALQLKPKVTQLQQLTVKLLNLHAQDLTDFLEQQVTENPLLDIRYPDVRPAGGSGREKPLENVQGHAESLEEMLMKQLRVLTVPKTVLIAAGLIIQSLDEKGFFDGNLDELGQDYGLSLEQMQQGLSVVQSLDPAGIGATSICEALVIQARRKDTMPAHTLELLETHYEAFLTGKWQLVQREMGLTSQELNAIRNFLKTLSLHPAQQIEQEEDYIRADAEIIVDAERRLQIRLLEEVPEVFFRDDLYENYLVDADKKTKSYVKHARRAFLNLENALAYRQRSVMLVLQQIAMTQEPFFLDAGALRPLTQKNVAGATGLSESTVSRVCRNRYILFHHRIYALQDFFAQAYACEQRGNENVSISDKAIREKIGMLIQEEDADHPYSDQQIAEHLQQEKIKIARRTVAKFRIELGFANSHMRRRMKE